MPTGVRSSLIAFVICTGFAAQAAGEPGTTWKDPPARQPEAAKASPRPAAPQTPAAVSPPPRQVASVVRKKRIAPRRLVSRQPRVHIVQQVHRVPRRATRIVTAAPVAPVVRRYAYPIYSDAGFPPSYEDQRLDRLSTAVSSGYLVMHRRTVEYPDGRMIRYYRPAEEDGLE